MGTTAEFNRIAELDHTYFVTVLFAEQGDGAKFLCLFDRQVAVFLQSYIFADLRIHQVFYLTDFFVSNLLEVREVETQ